MEIENGITEEWWKRWLFDREQRIKIQEAKK